MKWVFSNRASAILYNLFLSYRKKDKKIEFCLPSNICPIVPSICLKAKLKFRFVDVLKTNGCIDLKKTEKIIKNIESPGLIYVHNLGYIDKNLGSKFKRLKKIKKNIIIIDDRCSAKINFDIKKIEPKSDVTLYSTGYAKYVEMGFGGIAYLSKDVDYCPQKLNYNKRHLNNWVKNINYSLNNRKKFKYIDNNWLDTSIPKISISRFKQKIIEKQKKVEIHKSLLNEIYKTNLPKKIQAPTQLCNWRFSIFIKNKNLLIKNIFKKGLFASSHYDDVSEIFGFSGESTNAKKFEKNIVNLFNDYRFSRDDALEVCKIVNSHYKKIGN